MPALFNLEEANYVGTYPCTTHHPTAKKSGPIKAQWAEMQDPGYATSLKLLLMILE